VPFLCSLEDRFSALLEGGDLFTGERLPGCVRTILRLHLLREFHGLSRVEVMIPARLAALKGIRNCESSILSPASFVQNEVLANVDPGFLGPSRLCICLALDVS
jgi:hypothetical protein